MTYLKRTATITILPILLTSGTALASDHVGNADTNGNKDMTAKVHGQKLTLKNDTIGELLQSNGVVKTRSDNAVLMSMGHETDRGTLEYYEKDDDIGNNAIVVPALNADAITTVACPVGTTAQPDMTCLVTGNYIPYPLP